MYQFSTHQTPNEVLYSFHLSEALDLLQINAPTESNLGPTMTVEAHSTDEERVTERLRLQKAQRRDLLAIMSSY